MRIIVIPDMFRLAILLSTLMCFSAAIADDFFEDFQSGLGNWRAYSTDHARIVEEPGVANLVLELMPNDDDYSYVVLEREVPTGPVSMEGRFLFPVDGDGYLGFLYNYQQSAERIDFGCIYVKSNGNYVRISPHYDGNPSWRLYEEFKIPLDGAQSIETGRWYSFRLDVDGGRAALYINDMNQAIVTFDQAPTTSGRLGLEARPGFGEPVWVDDVQVTALKRPLPGTSAAKPHNLLGDWQFQPAVSDPADSALEFPELPETAWRELETDARGAIITGLLTQYRSGENSVVYLRARFQAPEGNDAAWLALSTANRVDVWSGGRYRGTAAPEPYIWSDHLDNPVHFGTRLPLPVVNPGDQELVLRVYGRRFAGGGFFSDILFP